MYEHTPHYNRFIIGSYPISFRENWKNGGIVRYRIVSRTFLREKENKKIPFTFLIQFSMSTLGLLGKKHR